VPRRLHPRDGRGVYVCTKPASHKGTKARPVSDGAKRFKAHEKAMREARVNRRAFLKQFAAGKVPNAAEITVRALLRRAEAEARKIACEILELEPVIEKSRYGENKRHDLALEVYAAKSAANLLPIDTSASRPRSSRRRAPASRTPRR
jgi:hypothetical protein